MTSEQAKYLEQVDQQFTIAEYNYLISYGWRPCGFYQTPDGVQTKELLWVPPPGYPTLSGKEAGVVTRHAINSQRLHRGETT